MKAGDMLTSVIRKLTRVRVAKGITQKTIANYLGVSKQAVSQWEDGANIPTANNLFKWAGFLEVDIIPRPAALINAHLPFPPTTNNLFNNKRSGGRTKSQNYRAWLSAAGGKIMAQRVAWPLKCISGPVDVVITLGKPDNRKRDAANYEKAVTDLLVKMGVIDDDSLIQSNTQEWGDVTGAVVSISKSARAA